MTNKKNTKRALTASVLSVILCVVMLVGTTFAWFTDSVTSSGNIIKSGNLDVAMEWADGKLALNTEEWTDASNGPIFNNDKWEPGYTEVRHVKISNKGNLALKYEIRLAATGQTSKLAEAIDVYYIKNGRQITGRDQLTQAEYAGTLKDVLANPCIATGHILAGTNSSDVATIALKMREDAGNEYQNLSIGSEFMIQLVATQYTAERDSFNEQYDKDAEFPGIVVKTTNELLFAMEAAKEGDKISFTSGQYMLPKDKELKTDATLVIPNGANVDVDLNGSTVASKHSDELDHATLLNYGNLTIKNGTIENNDTDRDSGTLTINAAINQLGGKLTITDCTIANDAGTLGSYCFRVIGGEAEITGCTIKGHRGGLGVENDATAIVKNCNISAGFYYPLSIYGDGHSQFIDTTFTKVPHEISGGGNFLIYNDFGHEKYGDKGDATFTNCTFISTRDGGSVLEVRTDDTEPAFSWLTFVDCKYKNVTKLPEIGFTPLP